MTGYELPMQSSPGGSSSAKIQPPLSFAAAQRCPKNRSTQTQSKRNPVRDVGITATRMRSSTARQQLHIKFHITIVGTTTNEQNLVPPTPPRFNYNNLSSRFNYRYGTHRMLYYTKYYTSMWAGRTVGSSPRYGTSATPRCSGIAPSAMPSHPTEPIPDARILLPQPQEQPMAILPPTTIRSAPRSRSTRFVTGSTIWTRIPRLKQVHCARW